MSKMSQALVNTTFIQEELDNYVEWLRQNGPNAFLSVFVGYTALALVILVWNCISQDPLRVPRIEIGTEIDLDEIEVEVDSDGSVVESESISDAESDDDSESDDGTIIHVDELVRAFEQMSEDYAELSKDYNVLIRSYDRLKHDNEVLRREVEYMRNDLKMRFENLETKLDLKFTANNFDIVLDKLARQVQGQGQVSAQVSRSPVCVPEKKALQKIDEEFENGLSTPSRKQRPVRKCALNVDYSKWLKDEFEDEDYDRYDM
jgi:hypothetical protein